MTKCHGLKCILICYNNHMQIHQTTIAITLAVIALIIECVMFWKVRKSGPKIFRYYTLISNFFLLIASAILIFDAVINQGTFSTVTKVCYFITTYGLTNTAIVYWFALWPRDRKKLKKAKTVQAKAKVMGDLKSISPSTSNLFWHTVCPILSLLTFLAIPVKLQGDIWMLVAVAPTILYMIIYLLLTATKSWRDPYRLFARSKKPALPIIALILIVLTGCVFALYYLQLIVA